MPWIRNVLACVAVCASSGSAEAASWPQFRGPNASGVADDGQKLPAEIGPEQNVVWKTPLPPGHSSPAIQGDRVYLTGVRGQTLLTIALDRATGKVLWEAKAPHPASEEIHRIGSHAQPSPAADGEVVVSFFGSSGLLCYDPDGKLLWQRPMGPFKNNFGAGSSPILEGNWVILSQDHDTDSFLTAIDKRTGKTVWNTDRSEFPRGYATPVIWTVAGKKQIVVVGTLRVIGYDFETGTEIWTVRGVARITNITPVVGADGILYVAAWAPGGDDSDRIQVPAFDETTATQDANKNGTLELDEVPDGPQKQRFNQIDRDKNGHITKLEYDYMRQIFHNAHNVMLAIRPGGTGDITRSHVLWTQNKQLPYVPSPLYYNGYVFMVKDGGILTCLDAKTGKPTKQGRVSGRASYFASPVAGDGKLYLLSQRGELTVVSAEPQWKELATARFDDDAYSTPAIAGGRIYLRAGGYLYCFGTPDAK